MGAIYKNDIPYSGGGGGGTGETPTLEQVLTKGNSTTNTIYFDGSGNDDTSVSGSGMYATGTGTEGMRQVVYNQHQISAVDNLVGTVTDIFKVDFDNEQVAMSDGIKDAFKTALDAQDTLVSGTNIKTINGQPILGSGNLILHQGVGDGLDLNDMPSYNELQQMFNDHALLYIEGNWLVTGLMYESDTVQVIGAYANATRNYSFNTNGDFDSPLTYNGTYTEGFSSKPDMVVGATGSQPFGRFQKGNNEEFILFGLADGISISFTDYQGRTQNKSYTIIPSYTVDRPEGTAVSGNVVQVGTLVNTDGTEYGIFEFYYKTSALPAADATKTYSFSPLLDNYTVSDFIDQSGITSNGHVISNGRTDGSNRIIIQQFSKNNKNVMLRAYGDFSSQTALLRIKFIGTKNA